MPKYVGDDESDLFIYWETLSRQPTEPENLSENSRKNENNRPGAIFRAIEYLESVVPHIKWRIKTDGHDKYGIQWDCIAVPNDQLSEAEEIMNRYLDGVDISNYSSMDLYPEIFVSIGGEKAICSDIQKFFNLCTNLGEILTASAVTLSDEEVNMMVDEERKKFFAKEKEKFLKKLQSLLDILTEIYFWGNKLPYVDRWFSGDKKYNYRSELSDYEDLLDLGEYNKFIYINPPFVGGKIEEGFLSAIIASIYFDAFNPAVDDFHSDDLMDVANAINFWHLHFKLYTDWTSAAANILTVLPVLNPIINDIKKTSKSFSR